MDAAPPQLQTFCGFEEGQTEANLSGQGLGVGDAVLLAWELTTGSMTSVDLSLNHLTRGAKKSSAPSWRNWPEDFETDITGIKAIADALSVSTSLNSLK